MKIAKPFQGGEQDGVRERGIGHAGASVGESQVALRVPMGSADGGCVPWRIKGSPSSGAVALRQVGQTSIFPASHLAGKGDPDGPP